MSGLGECGAVAAASNPYRQQRGEGDDLRLDANEGPVPAELGGVLASISGRALCRYPQVGELEGLLAERFDVDPARVVVTAGASDALDRTCRAFLSAGSELLVPTPTFGMLRRYAELAGARVREVEWWDEFPLDAFLEGLLPVTRLVGLISPNNPTGLSLRAETLRRVAAAAQERPVLFDYVYGDFADEELGSVALELTNVLLYGTFSKAWGLAGCRVGYVVAGEDAASAVRAAGGAYPVASPSLALAAAQLERGREGVSRYVTAVRRNRARLSKALEGLGIASLPSQANFVLADCGSATDRLWRGMAALGVRVRRFDESGLENRLRISVPASDTEFDRLEDALATCLAPDALLFDLDGVLADVENSYRRCVLETLASFGVRLRRDELQREVAAGEASNDWDLVARILGQRNQDIPREEIVATFQRIYLGSAGEGGLNRNERLLVSARRLRSWAGRCPLGLVTGRPRAEAKAFLERFHIEDLFAVTVTMEDAAAKPDPAPMALAMRGLGVERAWMVGDTVDDIAAARAAGVMPLGVVAPGDDKTAASSALTSAGAACVLDATRDLEGLLS